MTKLHLMMLAVMMLVICTGASADTVFIPDNGTLLGVTYNPSESEQDIKDLQSFEDWSGKNYSIVVVFQGFSPDDQSPFPRNQLNNLWQNGNTPLLTLEPWGSADILDVISNGTLDPYFEKYAQDMKNWTQESWTVDGKTGDRKQLFFRFAHEMNLHDCEECYPWSNRTPESYKAAWIRLHDLFESKNLTSDDVQWVWCVNNHDVPHDGHKAEEYYPGDDYVDWVAIDGYNPGKSVPCATWDNWTSFDGIFKPMLERFDNHPNISKKPYAIIEFASSSVVDSRPVKEFNIYTNKDSPTNHYTPSGWWGDWGDITFCDDDRSEPHLGIACGDTSVKLTYSAEGSQSNGWVGIRWQEGGYNLTGADNLTLWARGESGGEKVEFTAGDIDASTGTVTLTNIWQRYVIDDLTGRNLSHVICGFYWGTSKADNPDGCTIYLDDIRYESITGIKDVCVEEGVSNNTRKGEWITETYNSIKNYPNIGMVCYFNVDKGGTKYLTGESDWAVFTTPRDNRNNIDDCSFDPDKRIAQYNESVRDEHYIYRFPLYLEDKVVYVDDNFTDDPENHRWDSIQEGINDASDGYTIFVHNGTYYENVVVNKSLTLMGENRNSTIIDGVGSGEVTQVTANNCVISGFTVRNGGCGMELYYSSNNTITGNIISSNSRGIYLTNHSSNNTIAENTVADNRYYGIHIFYMNAENTIIANNVSNNGGDGIFLRDYNDNNVIMNNNIVSNNGDGIYLLWDCNHNNITGNTVLNNSMRGIYIKDSGDYNIIMNNNISSNMGDGILLHWRSDQNIITGNTVTNNQNGIVIRYSSDNNIVTNNTISSNNDTGISLTWVYYWGSSDNNLIYHNNLINNAKQAYDNGTNSWDSGSVDGGNYWNDHICTGNPSNGSQPYYIDKQGVDHHPFEDMDGWLPQKGDLNSDNQITPADAAIALQIAASGAHNPAANVSGDGSITSLDALMILQAAAGAIEL